MVDILLVEDNKELSGLMRKFIVAEGYSIYCARSGEEAVAYIQKESARVVLLDINLPGMDGFAVCAAIRKYGSIPIMIISARVDKESKINGFLQGADDFIEKPIDIDILMAKIAVVFKRNYEISENPAVIHSGELTINQDTMKVTLHNEPVNLSIKEYDLLLLLVENSGKNMSKEYLFSQIWGDNSDSENQTLTVHIKTLRDKIEDDSKKPQRIKTVWGIGYRYEEI